MKRIASKHPLWRRWTAICQAVNNTNSADYRWAGARGIIIEFKDFWEFADYIEAHLGDRTEEKPILRRKNVQGNYAPGNLVWSDSKELGRNNSRAIKLKYKNQTKDILDWAEELAISPYTIRQRHYQGWSVPEILGFKSRKKS